MFITQDLQRFHWSCSSGMLSMRLRADKTIVSCCGTFELFSQVCLVCQRAAWPPQTDTSAHVAANTPSGHKDAILSDEQSRGCRSKPNPFFFSFFFFFLSLCYACLCDYDWLATPCIKKPSIGLSEFLCFVSRGALGGK